MGEQLVVKACGLSASIRLVGCSKRIQRRLVQESGPQAMQNLTCGPCFQHGCISWRQPQLTNASRPEAELVSMFAIPLQWFSRHSSFALGPALLRIWTPAVLYSPTNNRPAAVPPTPYFNAKVKLLNDPAR